MNHSTSLALRGALLAGCASASVLAQAAGSCSAHSPATVVPVVELYTSEGCSSCPPADQWLSKLKQDPGVVALAFHVDYWDRLGWKDRFGSAQFTARQARQQTSNGARFSYTPQVVVDGRDRKDWDSQQAPSSKAARARANVEVTLQRDGERVVAQVQPLPGGPQHLAAYWALTESGHNTAVQGGENFGVTLKHDFVVRDYRPVAAWSARADAPETLDYQPAQPADPAHPRQVNLVVVDADTGRPLQALKLGC